MLAKDGAKTCQGFFEKATPRQWHPLSAEESLVSIMKKQYCLLIFLVPLLISCMDQDNQTVEKQKSNISRAITGSLSEDYARLRAGQLDNVDTGLFR